jgi:hypothetical protein
MTTQEESNSIELEDTFILYGHPTKPHLLKLSPKILSIIPKQAENRERSSTLNHLQSIPIDDIYGCLCMKSVKDPTQCYLTFYLYTLRRSYGIAGIFSKKLGLRRTQHIFTYAIYPEYERNYAEVIRWHRQIKLAIYLRQNLPRKCDEIFFKK